MKNKASISGRNSTLEIFKLLASLFIIFLHVPFSGKLASVMDCISHFAVPFFFIISGYFNLDADTQTISRRFFHIARLTLFSSLFYFVWYGFRSLYFTGSIFGYLTNIFTYRNLLNWIILNINPLSDHLWYLSALLYCYFFLWLYTILFYKKFHYSILYIWGFFILFCTLVLDGPVSTYIRYIPHYLYRNAWFMGISLFVVGLFLHSKQSILFKQFHISAPKQIFLIILGLFLSILQKRTIGTAEISLGSILVALGLMLFCLSHPIVASPSSGFQKFISRSGFYSTTVYIIHLAIIDLYSTFIQVRLNNLYPIAEPILRPFIIFLFSLIVSILYDHAIRIFRKKRKS